MDKTLFIRKVDSDIILVQVYVDDIIFDSTNEKLCYEILVAMQGEFEMSMIGEMNYFLGLQIKQLKHGTFFTQSKYCKELLKKFEVERCKGATTPIPTSYYLYVDEKRVVVDQTMYKGLISSILYLIPVGMILC